MNDPKNTKPAAQTLAKPALAVRPNLISAAEGKVARRTGALFKALSSDFLLREQFVTDPSQVLGEFVLGERPSAEAGDVANQLVYAVMSNPGLRDWMGAYARQQNGATPPRDDFAHSFAKAVARHGDDLTVLALIRGATGENDHFALQADLLRSFVGLIGAGRVSASTNDSGGGPGPGTNPSPGPGGTQHSLPGGIFTNPGSIFHGTEMSPGGGTEQSGTHMSPGAIFSGTEMSPGGGTEQSGTHMSPGALGSGWQLSAHLQVSFAALVQYSNLLRARGALNRSGLEGR